MPKINTGSLEFENKKEIPDSISSLTEEELVYIRNRTSEDCRKTIKKDCTYCKYSSAMYAGSMAGGNITCDYIGWTGHIRPCLPGMCREAGVFTTKVNNEKHPNQMPFKSSRL